MGAILSTLNEAYRALHLAIAELDRSNKSFSAVLTRINAGPGLPQPQSTAPFWLNDPPFPELINIQSPELPSQADIVIVGSGITGAAIAWSLTQQCKTLGIKRKIVILEAREISSGATGRNGGHIKTASYRTFTELKKRIGVEKTLEVVKFQLMHLGVLVGLCEREGFEVAECRKVQTVDLILGEEEFRNAKEGVGNFKNAMKEVDIKIWEAEEAREKFGASEHVAGAISYEAGALWPYRLVTSVWKKLLSDHPSGVLVETSTPAESIDNQGSKEHPFRIHTPRGIIVATHVVHATNAFAAHLLPGLKGKMAGVRGHMTAQKPGPQFPGEGSKQSCSWMYGNSFDYMTKRPGKDGEVMLGGGLSRSLNQGLSDLGIWADDTTDPLIKAHLQGIVPAVFGRNGRGTVLVQSWSGVMGFTADLLPFVGKLDPKITGRKSVSDEKDSRGTLPSEWIAAGFCGEGMVMSWLSGVAIALMILGLEDEILPEASGRSGGKMKDWLPATFVPEYSRIRKLSMLDAASAL